MIDLVSTVVEARRGCGRCCKQRRWNESHRPSRGVLVVYSGFRYLPPTRPSPPLVAPASCPVGKIDLPGSFTGRLDSIYALARHGRWESKASLTRDRVENGLVGRVRGQRSEWDWTMMQSCGEVGRRSDSIVVQRSFALGSATACVRS